MELLFRDLNSTTKRTLPVYILLQISPILDDDEDAAKINDGGWHEKRRGYEEEQSKRPRKKTHARILRAPQPNKDDRLQQPAEEYP